MSEWQKLREAIEAPRSVYVVLNGADQYLCSHDTQEVAMKFARDLLCEYGTIKIIQDFVNVSAHVSRTVAVLIQTVHDHT